jgi:hypothetical protein
MLSVKGYIFFTCWEEKGHKKVFLLTKGFTKHNRFCETHTHLLNLGQVLPLR